MHQWKPTHCTLKLSFIRSSDGSETQMLRPGDSYCGTSIIRYVLYSSSACQEMEALDVSKGGYVKGGSVHAARSLGGGLHFHAITGSVPWLPKARPLVLNSIKVLHHTGCGSVPCKVLRVSEEGATNAPGGASVDCESWSGDRCEKARKVRKHTTTKKMKTQETQPSEGEQGFYTHTVGSELAQAADVGSKRVWFDGEPDMPPGSTVDLVVTFTGAIQGPDQGGIYTNVSGSEAMPRASQGVLLTHFEVALARLAFPCPDDPQLYRIMWQLQSLQLPEEYNVVVSNTAELTRKTVGNKGVQYTFYPIGPLPAYVIAFAAFSGAVVSLEETLELRRDSGRNVSAQLHRNGCGTYERKSVPLRVLTAETSAVTATMLSQIAHITQEAVLLLEDFFDSPLPLQVLPFADPSDHENFLHDEESLTIVIGPTMPYISGMEHHGCIFLNESVYRTSGDKGLKDATSRVMLIVHELAHHWIGNLLGMPFVLKEGVCQFIESIFGDMIIGKSARKMRAVTGTPASLAPASSHGAGSNGSSSVATMGVVDTERGKEFTAYSYQKALDALRDVVAHVGFDAFRERMRCMYHAKVLAGEVRCTATGMCVDEPDDAMDGTPVMECKNATLMSPLYVTADEFLTFMSGRGGESVGTSHS
ncbi:putative Peptidase family M1 [Trypanosoma vivax]|nr:putative metallo-peptidase, Clan MA(E) Family M1 [Trypanosoma vivax]KAH8617728.1 putative Peptidase family M1 [Trypanosoma vivax]